MLLTILYTAHAEEKILSELSKFNISKNIIKETILNPDELLYNTKTSRRIAINYNSNIAVILEDRDTNILIITVIYSSMLKKIVSRRKRSGRWV